VKETDLFIEAERDLTTEAINYVLKFREEIERYIEKNPDFRVALRPCKVDKEAPLIIKDMAYTSARVGVGPFASIAGVIAEYVGKSLLMHSSQVIVENGGDIFIKSSKERVVGIYAGSSPFNMRIGLKIKGEKTPLGICTSSGTVGHSLSFGEADAVVVISKSTPLADAAATYIGNHIKRKEDIFYGIKLAQRIKGIKGIIIIKDDNIGVWGKIINLCQI
jgi:ApbE superfamily uncharacterized protein (UPF0280 family)